MINKGLLVKITLFSISTLLTLFMAEFVLRQISPLDSGKSHAFRIPHPVLGWSLKPNSSYTNYLPEGTAKVEYNSIGLRDTEHLIKNTEGVFRILILGDSFMEAYSVDTYDAFHKQVEKNLASLGIKSELINLGVGGYGTLQEYLIFNEIGRSYSPDLVMLGFFYGNDLIDNSNSKAISSNSKRRNKPYLNPDSDDWQIVPFDFEASKERYAVEKAKQFPLGEKNSRRSALIWKVSEEFNRVLIQVKQYLFSNKKSEESLDDNQLCSDPKEYARAWDITKRIISQLKNEVEGMGSQLVVFSVPSIHTAENKDIKKEITSENLCNEKAGFSRLNKMLDKLDIVFIDLFPHFSKAMQEDALELFRYSDEHWNSKGHSLAAKIVTSSIVEKGLLPVPAQ